jgi:hypothetical protein
MTAWIKCTAETGDDIWINLDGATRMFRLSNKLTRVCFPGDENEYEDVKESPKLLVGRAQKKHVSNIKWTAGRA